MPGLGNWRAHVRMRVAGALAGRTARRYFTPAELEHAEIHGRRLTVADAEFRLAVRRLRPTLELVTVPDDNWLRDHLARLPAAERTWEAVAFVKVRRLATPEAIVERARSGELYDESYFTKRGGGAPYVGYPQEYAGDSPSPRRLAAEIVRAYLPKRVLDVGCATGLLVRELERRGVQAAGIDLSTWAAEHAVSDAVVHGSAAALPWPDASFDLVISQDFMEHVHPDDLPQVLAEQVRVLRPGGAIVHLIPFYPFDPPIQVDAHLCQATREWWTRLFSSLDGLTVTRSPNPDASRLLDRYFEMRRSAA